MSKRNLDKRQSPGKIKAEQFFKLDRKRREGWHQSHALPSSTRLVQFLRIARGRTV